MEMRILREIDVAHPAEKNMIQLSRTQDEEYGDRTTSVIILTAYPSLSTLATTPRCSPSSRPHRPHDVNGLKIVDIKRYARVEKIPAGNVEQSKAVKAVMLNKDVTNPNMRSWTEKSGIVLLDWPLGYKKGKSQTNMGFSKEADWARAQEMEEERVEGLCYKMLKLDIHLVITEKGCSDLAQRVFTQHNVPAIRRVWKSDDNHVVLAVGATVANRFEDLREAENAGFST